MERVRKGHRIRVSTVIVGVMRRSVFSIGLGSLCVSVAVHFTPDVLCLFLLLLPPPQDMCGRRHIGFRPPMSRRCGKAGSGCWLSHGRRSYAPLHNSAKRPWRRFGVGESDSLGDRHRT